MRRLPKLNLLEFSDFQFIPRKTDDDFIVSDSLLEMSIDGNHTEARMAEGQDFYIRTAGLRFKLPGNVFLRFARDLCSFFEVQN